ncbi:MAG TPA: hypothetical protein VFR79_05055 [Nitrospira sp.]|nr:hypothetical protein [Nitrospira sp.]
MTPRLMKQSLAVLLVLCLLTVGGLAAAQSISHESHHAHHHKATHGTVLCTWMCAAGQVLDTVTAPALVERAPISFIELCSTSECSSHFSSPLVSRGPPILPTA